MNSKSNYWLTVFKIFLFIGIITSFFIKIIFFITTGVVLWLLLGALGTGIYNRMHKNKPEKNNWKTALFGPITFCIFPHVTFYGIIMLINAFPKTIQWLSSGFQKNIE